MRIKHVHADIEWKNFDASEIILPICARSQGVRGRNFAATIHAMKGKVDTVHMVMCDTLDRHNLNDDAALAVQRADEWLAQNLQLVTRDFNVTMKRWDDVVADASFASRHDLLKALYATNDTVRGTIDRISSYYVESKQARLASVGLPFNAVQEQAAAARYLVEEFAGTAVYKDWYPGLPEAYWGVYVGDVNVFNANNDIDRSIDLTLPETLAIHVSRLPAPIVGERPRLVA